MHLNNEQGSIPVSALLVHDPLMAGLETEARFSLTLSLGGELIPACGSVSSSRNSGDVEGDGEGQREFTGI